MSFIEKIINQSNAFEGSTNFDSLRKNAAEKIKELGIPTTKHEEWKYTNLKSIANSDLSSDSTFSKENIDNESLKIDNLDSYKITVINGQYINELSDKVSEGNIIVCSLKEAISNHTDLVSKYLYQLTDTDNHHFSALSTALGNDGVFIHVPKSSTLSKPLEIDFIHQSNDREVLTQPRNLYIVEENAEASVIEKFHHQGNTIGLANTVSEIKVGESARFNVYKLQTYAAEAQQIDTTQVEQEGKSTFKISTITTSGKLIRNNLNIKLIGEYSETFMNGLYLLNGSSHVDNHTMVDHTMPNCYSDEMYKGIMDEKSTGVFNGKVFVRPDAQKTNAFQSNRNVLLTDDATINTKPQLEIWADDVKCSHGATTGQLDEEALFYLKARGIGERKAKGLLLAAFANEVAERIPLEAISNSIEKIIEERIV